MVERAGDKDKDLSFTQNLHGAEHFPHSMLSENEQMESRTFMV